MLDVELATPGIDGQDQTHVPTHKRDPLMLCRIIETFMMGTIQEFYHRFLVQGSMIHSNTIQMLCVSEQLSMHLMATNLPRRYL
jgi:hypothetical protein